MQNFEYLFAGFYLFG